jgi:hypothetical protein
MEGARDLFYYSPTTATVSDVKFNRLSQQQQHAF